VSRPFGRVKGAPPFETLKSSLAQLGVNAAHSSRQAINGVELWSKYETQLVKELGGPNVSELSQELPSFNLPWVFHFRAYLESRISDIRQFGEYPTKLSKVVSRGF
jgi:hypothetical protein